MPIVYVVLFPLLCRHFRLAQRPSTTYPSIYYLPIGFPLQGQNISASHKKHMIFPAEKNDTDPVSGYLHTKIWVIFWNNSCYVGRKLAEGVGFEPTGRVNAQRFSRPPLSAAQPSLRVNNSIELRAKSLEIIPNLRPKPSTQFRTFNYTIRALNFHYEL